MIVRVLLVICLAVIAAWFVTDQMGSAMTYVKHTFAWMYY